MQQGLEKAIQGTLRRAFRRHEGMLVRLWLVVVPCVLLLSGWALLSGHGDRLILWREQRWGMELERCAALVTKERWEDAAVELELLDARFPAVHRRHRLDVQRERLLGLLADAYRHLDRKRRCLDTLSRLVRFDPRNFDNHYRLACALQYFDEGDDAFEAYREVLLIHPNHLPSVTALIVGAFEAGRFGAAIETFDAYLSAYQSVPLHVSVGSQVLRTRVVLDGRRHVLLVPVGPPGGPPVDPKEAWDGRLEIKSRAPSLTVERLVVQSPQLVGRAGAGGRLELSALGEIEAEVSGGAWLADGVLLADLVPGTPPSVTLELDFELSDVTASALLLEVTPRKSVDLALWETVSKSFVNNLEFERRTAVHQRVHVRPRHPRVDAATAGADR